jgi:hypothetical protein
MCIFVPYVVYSPLRSLPGMALNNILSMFLGPHFLNYTEHKGTQSVFY